MLSSALSYTVQTCLPRDRAAHSGPWPPTSITNPDNPLTELPQMSLSCIQLKLKVTRICVFQSFHDSRETNWRQAGRQGQEVLTLRIQSSVKSAVIREGSRVEACGILERDEKLRRLSLPATVVQEKEGRVTGKATAFPTTGISPGKGQNPVSQCHQQS